MILKACCLIIFHMHTHSLVGWKGPIAGPRWSGSSLYSFHNILLITHADLLALCLNCKRSLCITKRPLPSELLLQLLERNLCPKMSEDPIRTMSKAYLICSLHRLCIGRSHFQGDEALESISCLHHLLEKDGFLRFHQSPRSAIPSSSSRSSDTVHIFAHVDRSIVADDVLDFGYVHASCDQI